jgi:hypothetical protein
MPFGIRISATETAQSAGTSISTGTGFPIGLTDSGPFTPVLCKSLAAYVATFGERSATSSIMYDAVQTYFALQGSQLYVTRAGKESSATAASKELATAGATKVLVVKAKYRGTAGNKIKLEPTATSLVITNEAGEVLETIKGTKASEFVGVTSPYVTIEEGSEYATGKGEALKAAAAAAMTGGANPATEITEALAKEALERILKTYGPGQVWIPATEKEPVKEGIHKLMGEHCQATKNNRVAICDIANSAAVATLLTNKEGPYASGIAGYMIFHSSSCIIPGITAGTTRTVAGSSVIAGLCAQVASTGNDNQAPIGIGWAPPALPAGGISNWVTGFTNTFTIAQMQELSEAGINAWYVTPSGIPCLYGFVTALPYTTDKIYWQATATRERMHLIWQSEEILERFFGRTIDGRGILLSKLQGELQGMIAEHWKENALYGESAATAGVANVGEPINSPATEQAGELNAELKVRISPYANSVSEIIVSVPITESVGS